MLRDAIQWQDSTPGEEKGFNFSFIWLWDGWLNTHNEKAPVPFIMEP